MTEVEDFKAATIRLLGKLPRTDAVARREGMLSPRIEIEAGTARYFAFAADPGELKFLGILETGGSMTARWRTFSIDADGHLVDGGQHLRIRRMDWEDGGDGAQVRAWPDFAKARKVRSP